MAGRRGVDLLVASGSVDVEDDAVGYVAGAGAEEEANEVAAGRRGGREVDACRVDGRVELLSAQE
jgi:hypothetical protein